MRAAPLVIILALGQPQGAQQPPRCGDQAGDTLFAARSWRQLREWRDRYPHCDDGYLAEGVSEYVTTWLAKEWKSVPQLNAEIRATRTSESSF